VGRYHKRCPVFSVSYLSGSNALMHGLLRRARPTHEASYLKFVFNLILNLVLILFSISIDFFQFCLNSVHNAVR
jgi:hypothetical protein